MASGFFVTGTDTSVGKTTVACALLHAFAAAGKSVAGMKPVATGCINGRSPDAEALARAGSVSVPARLASPCAFEPAIAPHIAAELAGAEIDIDAIVRAFRELSGLAEIVIVEGTGGFMLPLNARQTGADMARRLQLPVVLVVGMRLGCLSHALLTRRAIDACGLLCAGWVANSMLPEMPYLERNIRALDARLDCPLLGVVPFRQDAAPRGVAPLLTLAPLLETTSLSLSTSDGRRMSQRSLRAVWHPCTQMKHHEKLPPLPIRRAQGVWLYDFEGRRILDAISSWWVNLLGHGNPRINAALHAQLDTLEHVMLAGFTHAPVVELSERLARLAPGGRLGHCFYGSDGAAAIEIALKMSFHYWHNAGRPGKNRFVTLQNGYHGETLGALSVTDIALFGDTYAPLLRRSDRVPSPDWRRAEPGESPRDYALRCARSLETHLERHGDETAALILEPLVQCAGGMAMHDAEYLRRARELCDRFEIHLIADEIAVGFGRTGTLFACEQAGIAPDFLCLSKGLTGGYLPLSVVMTSDSVYAAFYDDRLARGFLHSHSYSGNPLACRAALAVLDILEQDQVLQRNRRIAAYMNERTQALRSRPGITNFRNTGMIWAFDVTGAGPDFGSAFYRRAVEAGVLLRPLGNTVYWMPPYVIGEPEIDFLAGVLEKQIEN